MLMSISEEKLVRPVRNNIINYLYRKVTNLEADKVKNFLYHIYVLWLCGVVKKE
ncbi:hypothetical protein C820_001709 [Clostridium sp. MD294]|nr:hypothetical protein C820_001709 [Clostridium sp. MD294]